MELDTLDQENMRVFLSAVYGPQVNSWPMNNKVFELTYLLLQKSGKCSDLMDLVPRPMPTGQPASKYISKQIKKTLLRKLKERKNHYMVCVRSVSWSLRTDFIYVAYDL